jgi:HAE1 family hydrophobic/amphiphilic exporter-1
LFVNNITLFGRNTPVTIQAEAEYRDDPGDISNVYVRNADGKMVPVSTLVTVENILGPQTLTRFNLYNAVNITGEAAPGKSSGDAVASMQEIATSLPTGFGYEWTGATFQELRAGNVAVFAFLLALLFAYLFLVAQYESWMIPLAILLVVPTALLGAFLHTMLAGGDINLYTQIGLVLLIGMAARNAILIVEFAKKLHEDDGKPLLEAAETAGRLRLRPLLMTAFAFMLGVFPLVIASGAGDGSRQALGQAVFGGMLSATIIGALLTPAFYVLIERMRKRFRPGSQTVARPAD